MIREFEGVLGDWCHLAHIQQERYVQPPLFPPRSRGGQTLQIKAFLGTFLARITRRVSWNAPVIRGSPQLLRFAQLIWGEFTPLYFYAHAHV